MPITNDASATPFRPKAEIFAIAAAALFAAAGSFWSVQHALGKWDGLHWGSVIARSMRICEGAPPFTDVPIFYGPLSFYLYCAVGSLTEFSNLTFGIATFVAYTIIIGSWTLIGRRLGFSSLGVALFIAIAALCHPFPQYPWYDYIAGAFFGMGCLAVIAFRAASWRTATLSAGLICAAVLARTTYAPMVIVGLTALYILKFLNPAAIARLLGASLGYILLFFAFIWIVYGVTPVDVLSIMIDNTLLIGSVFDKNGFKNFLSWPMSQPVVLFNVALASGLCYFLAEWPDTTKNYRVGIAFYLASLVGYALNTHIFEFFRLICATPYLLLLLSETSSRTFQNLSCSSRGVFRTSVRAVSLALILYVAAVSATRYPNATALFPARANNAISGWSVMGIRFHSNEQAQFYESVVKACGKRALINMTGDVLISRMCSTNVIVADTLYETKLWIAAHRPDLATRLLNSRPRLKDGEVLFTYQADIGELKLITTIPNRKQDWVSTDIYVYEAF